MTAVTNYALARRAILAADFLEICRKEFRRELKVQKIDIDGLGFHPGETMTIPVGTIKNMVLRMANLTREIRRFKPPNSK
jgi:hypothetical protein